MLLETVGRSLTIKRHKGCRQLGRCFRISLLLALSGLLLWVGMLHARQTGYVYDANGRVVAVTANSSSTVQYSYNSVGHIKKTNAPMPAGQTAIFTFSPTHGVAGTTVAIQGQAFDGSVAGNAVTFNGAPASIIAASNNQLSVVVPAGTSSGPIGVTTNGQPITSAMPFTVDDTGAPPTIVQLNPMVAAVGELVAISGTHLYPIADSTTVQMGGENIFSIPSASDSKLQYIVPSDAVSGFVTVTTPYGEAVSATPIALLPSNVINTFSSVKSHYVIVNGPITNFGTDTAGQSAVMTFNAEQGDNVELTLNGITISGSSSTGVTVNVFSPSGVNMNIPYPGCSSTNPGAGCRLPLWNLPAGTYSVVVSPMDASAIMSFNVILDKDQVGPQLTANAPSEIALGAGQSERVTFNANAGDSAVLRLSGVNTSAPSGQQMLVQVWSPGASITGQDVYTSFDTTGSDSVNLTNLPATGIYTIVISTQYGTPGTGQVTWGPAIEGTLLQNGAAQSYQAYVPGQNIYLTFQADQDDNFELTFDNISSVGGGSGAMSVNVFDPTGANMNIPYPGCSTDNPGSSCRIPLWNLTAGTYLVVLSPQSVNTQISFKTTLLPDLIGSTLAVSAPINISLGQGQSERLSFNANAGEALALQLSGVNTVDPSGQPMYVQIWRPDAGTITGQNIYTTAQTATSTLINLPNLPVSGTYPIVVSLPYGTPGSARLALVQGVTSTLTENGPATNLQASTGGQDVYLTFTVNQGDNLELTFNGISVTGSGNSQLLINVYDPSGNNMHIAYPACSTSSPGSGCRLPLWNLVAGTYSVVVSPGDANGVIDFNATLDTDIIGPELIGNTPTTVNLLAGQSERFTFDANVGSNVALQLSDVSTSAPTGQAVNVQIWRPDAGTITGQNIYSTFSASTSNTDVLRNLPVSGTYTVVVSTGWGTPASGQLTFAPQ